MALVPPHSLQSGGLILLIDFMDSMDKEEIVHD
ncbi:hypothetical protein [Acinetobacter dispersus]